MPFGGFLAGSIVGKMVLDRTKWSQSIGEVKKDEKTLGGMSARTTGNFRKMGTAMTVAGGVIVASFGKMISRYVEAGDEIDKMSKRTGFAATTLSELKYAIDISGASLEDLEKGVKRMSKTIVDASEGMATYQRAFQRIGVNIEGLQKLNIEDQFLAIANAIAKVEDPTIRAATAQDIFGRAGTKLLPLFKEGEDGMRALREEAHRLGIIYDQEAAANAAKLKDAQTSLKYAFQGLGISLAEKLIPTLTEFIDKITNVVAKVNQWAKAHPGLFSTLSKVAAALGGVMTVLGPMLIILPKLVAGIALLKGALIALAGPMGLVVAGVTAITVGLIKMKAAQEAANEAAQRALEAETNLFEKLKKAADAAGFTEKEFLKLRDAYDGNAAAMAMAIKRGKEGKELQESLAKVGAEHREEVEEQRKAYEDSAGALSDLSAAYAAVAKKQQTWTEYLKSISIMTIAEKNSRVAELESILDDLKKAYDAGKISLEDYEAAQRSATDEIGKYEWNAEAAAKASRGFADGLIPAKMELERTALATMTADEKLVEFARIAGITTEEVKRRFYLLSAEALRFAGFSIPQITLSNKAAWPQIRDEVAKSESVFTKVSQRIKDQWTTGLADMLKGARSWKDVIGGIFGTIKDQFFTLIAQMVTKWTIGLVGGILDGSKGLLSGVKDTFSGVGDFISGLFGKTKDKVADAAGAAADAAGGVADAAGEMGGGFLSTISKMAGPIGIGLLVSKFVDLKKVGEAVTGALVSAFEAVGTVITGIGNAASTILGGIASGIAGAATSLGGLISGLTGLLTGGGKKYSEITYWLSLLREINQNSLNNLKGINWWAGHSGKRIQAINQSTQKAEELLDGRFTKWVEYIKSKSQSIDNRLREIAGALTKKGTIYVDVFSSSVIENLGKSLQGSLKEVSRAEAVKKQLSQLEHRTENIIKDLKHKLIHAEGEERAKLQKAIEKQMVDAQKRRKELLDQLHRIESAQSSAASSIAGGFTDAIGKLPEFFKSVVPEAQHGAIITEPQLIMAHGTPGAPEIIAPAPVIREIVAGGARPVNVVIHNDIRLQGTIITDREYARRRLVPEIVSALDDNAGKMKRRLKNILGVS